jgi:mono/diheme cytochrome c family protein
MAWDSVIKEASVTNGVLTASFVFRGTNISATNVIITHTQTSCGCTVAKLPSEPWVLPPGSNGEIEVEVNLAGKVGSIAKGVQVYLTNQPMPIFLTVKVNIAAPPPMSDADRAKNRQVSMSDAQAVFKGSCADCHLTPARGRLGATLFDTLCGVCHEAPPDRRASMVPNLRALNKPTDYEFWMNTISNGKTNSLMPAFSDAHGGPLNQFQINSLVEYLARSFSPTPAKSPASQTTSASTPVAGQVIPGLKPLPPIKKIAPVAPPTPPTPPTVPVVQPIALPASATNAAMTR